MTQEHPITPPPELVKEWATANDAVYQDLFVFCENIATEAARWGADQELLACGNYLEKCAAWEPEDVTEFYGYRRLKPPSLKERALIELGDVYNRDKIDDVTYDIIRKALEQLND